MLKNVYEGLNARSKVYLSKKYFLQNVPDLRVPTIGIEPLVNKLLLKVYVKISIERLCEIRSRWGSRKTCLWTPDLSSVCIRIAGYANWIHQ